MTEAFALSRPSSIAGSAVSLPSISAPQRAYTFVISPRDVLMSGMEVHVTSSGARDHEQLRIIAGYEKLAEAENSIEGAAYAATRRARRDRNRALRAV